MLYLENLSIKTKNKTIIKKFSYIFSPGINYITGYSGSGKSTLMDAIAGVSKHEIHGKISHGERLITSDMVSHLQTETQIYDFLTFNDLLFFFKNTWQINQEFLQNIMSLVNDIDKNKKISCYSSGQRKRCKLVFDLICEKDIICLDEPYANLSPNDQEEVTKAIIETTKINKNVIVVISTHHKNLLLDNKNCLNISNGICSVVSEIKNDTHKPAMKKSLKILFPFYKRIYSLLCLEFFYAKNNFIGTIVGSHIAIIFIIGLTQICIPLEDDFTTQFKMIISLCYTIIVASNHDTNNMNRRACYDQLILNINKKNTKYSDFVCYLLIYNLIQAIYFTSICMACVNMFYTIDTLLGKTFVFGIIAVYISRLISFHLLFIYGPSIRSIYIYLMSIMCYFNSGLLISYNECNWFAKMLFYNYQTMLISILYDEMVIDINPINFSSDTIIYIILYNILIIIYLFYRLKLKLNKQQKYIIDDNNIELEELLP